MQGLCKGPKTISTPISPQHSSASPFSSLALGWIGEPALARLIEPYLSGLFGSFATIGAHGIAITVAFIIITALHIVLGELAPKSLALQRANAPPSRWSVPSAYSGSCSGLRL